MTVVCVFVCVFHRPWWSRSVLEPLYVSLTCTRRCSVAATSPCWLWTLNTEGKASVRLGVCRIKRKLQNSFKEPFVSLTAKSLYANAKFRSARVHVKHFGCCPSYTIRFCAFISSKYFLKTDSCFSLSGTNLVKKAIYAMVEGDCDEVSHMKQSLRQNVSES